MAALETTYDPETNQDFLTNNIETRLNKVDETLRVLTQFLKDHVHKKNNKTKKAQLRKIKSSIEKIRKGRKAMIDASNLIRNTLKLEIIQSVSAHDSPLPDISPNSNSPEQKSQPTTKSKTKKLFSKLMSSKSKSKSGSKPPKTIVKKGGIRKCKTQKKKRI